MKCVGRMGNEIYKPCSKDAEVVFRGNSLCKECAELRVKESVKITQDFIQHQKRWRLWKPWTW